MQRQKTPPVPAISVVFPMHQRSITPPQNMSFFLTRYAVGPILPSAYTTCPQDASGRRLGSSCTSLLVGASSAIARAERKKGHLGVVDIRTIQFVPSHVSVHGVSQSA